MAINVALLAFKQGTAAGVHSCLAGSLSLLPTALCASAAQTTQARGFSSRIVDMMTLPSLKRERARTMHDLQLVGSTFLKHRSLYHAQFTPHGIQLVPKSIIQATPTATAGAGSGGTTSLAASAVASRSLEQTRSRAAAIAAEVAELRRQLRQAGVKLHALEGSLLHEEEEEEAVQATCGGSETPTMLAADKTKAWRRLKIKKHKINKRRKLNRYKTK